MNDLRTFRVAISLLLFASLVGMACESAPAAPVRDLPNGIRLPAAWPPPDTPAPAAEPMAVPYLKHAPDVIPIDVGRQLFVDDFLIEQTDLVRTFHKPQLHTDNPVVRPDKPWEQTSPNSSAMVFSDGVWFDPADRLFKMWYMGGYSTGTCYATSKDGIHWDKPSLDSVRPGTNLVHQDRRDSSTVWLDQLERDPTRRFKMALVHYDPTPGVVPCTLRILASPDGIHWSQPLASAQTPWGDRSTVFYNPFRQVWVFGLRGESDRRRARLHFEDPDLIQGTRKLAAGAKPLPWVGADRLDPPRQDLKITPQLYNLDAVAYESLMLGMFSIWRGQPGDRPKPNDLVLGYSRDGFHWDRPDRTPFIAPSEHPGDWNWGNVQSAGGVCLIVGDKLYFYFSARSGKPGAKTHDSGVCATGLATLRRDGFASMDAKKDAGGTLTTRKVRFAGKQLFLNADVGSGLRVEVLDADGKVIQPFNADNCRAVTGSGTRLAITWNGAVDLSFLAGKPVRFRFHIPTGGRLYAFWVTPDASGASHGYVAAGGPGFTGPTDTVGGGAN